MEAEDHAAAGCCLSLICQEDGADLGDSFTSDGGGCGLLLMYSGTGENQAPALSEFSADSDYEFCCDSIRRMELLVLSTLDWRMGAVTPFDYLPCLSSRLRRGSGGGGLVAVKAGALIFFAAEVGSVLDYRPSAVAVAAVLAATYGVLSRDTLESEMPPSCLLEKDDVCQPHCSPEAFL